MKVPQRSIAGRPKLMKQLWVTAMEIFKCLKREEFSRCLCMFRTARKDDDVSEEMPDYLIAKCSNVYLSVTHTQFGMCI